MRNGVVGGLLCLVGLQSQVNCQVNWKNSKVSRKLLGNLKHLIPPWVDILPFPERGGE